MRLWVLLLAPLLVAAQCGPTREQVGGAVLLAAPVAFLFMALVLRGLTALFRPVMGPDARWRPVIGGLAVWLLLTAVVALPVSMRVDAFDWFPTALVSYGATVAAAVLLTWRVWVAVRPQSAFHGALLWAHAVMTLPAIPLALMAHEGPQQDQLTDFLITVWVLGGYLGAVGGTILLVLLIEGVVRRQRAARA